MNLLEQQLDYPLGEALPAPGTALTVAPGVRWLRMGLPFALNHINLWLLRDELEDPAHPGLTLQGWTVVDCCISATESRTQWESVFATQLEGLPILRVIVTHMHPDHIGLAAWLCDRWTTPSHTCRLWISATDYGAALNGARGSTGFGGDSAALFFASHGLTDPDSLETIKRRSAYYPGLVPDVPASYVRLMDGKTVRIGSGQDQHDWRCISGYGHAPEHIALYCARLGVLIAGDMVLPRISTNVSVYDQEPEADALALFLASIKKYLLLPADTLVLPSHGKPFTGLHTRIGQLQDHHRDRLEEVVQACAGQPHSAADVVPLMFKRPLDLHQLTFALGEALAHLHLLWFEGTLTRRLCADGIYRFEA
ncbi:MAG: MBL fold metallo-hydrolase [Polaromonas sp.]|nr:MBL fold metallo-hydrolase [Polaromonas sp.]